MILVLHMPMLTLHATAMSQCTLHTCSDAANPCVVFNMGKCLPVSIG